MLTACRNWTPNTTPLQRQFHLVKGYGWQAKQSEILQARVASMHVTQWCVFLWIQDTVVLSEEVGILNIEIGRNAIGVNGVDKFISLRSSNSTRLECDLNVMRYWEWVALEIMPHLCIKDHRTDFWRDDMSGISIGGSTDLHIIRNGTKVCKKDTQISCCALHCSHWHPFF